MHGIEGLQKDKLVRGLNEMFEALSDSLSRARDAKGICRYCSAESGVKHAKSCAFWPLIVAKAGIVNQTEETGRMDLSTFPQRF